MELVSNSALIEAKSEKIEERALDVLKASVAELANALKDLRWATDRLVTNSSTMASITTQIQSLITEHSQLLYRIEHNPNRSMSFSSSVASSTITSCLPVPIGPHLHLPQPAIPSFTSSIQLYIPQIAISDSTTTEQIRHSRTNRIDRLPLQTVNSSCSSIETSLMTSTSKNFPHTAITYCNTFGQPHPDRITSSASTTSHIQQPFNEIPRFPTLIERQTVSFVNLLVRPPSSPPPSPTFSSHFHCLPPSKLFLHTMETSEEEPVIMEYLFEEEQVVAVGHSCGLYNLGNACYMNSTMQCLFSIPKLRYALLHYSQSGQSNDFN